VRLPGTKESEPSAHIRTSGASKARPPLAFPAPQSLACSCDPASAPPASPWCTDSRRPLASRLTRERVAPPSAWCSGCLPDHCAGEQRSAHKKNPRARCRCARERMADRIVNWRVSLTQARRYLSRHASRIPCTQPAIPRSEPAAHASCRGDTSRSCRMRRCLCRTRSRPSASRSSFS
jgi:hypothetical protein